MKFLSVSQGRNLASTVLCVPHSEVQVVKVRDLPDSPDAWQLEEFQVKNFSIQEQQLGRNVKRF